MQKSFIITLYQLSFGINLLAKIAEGKTKIVLTSPIEGYVLLKFKDDITALDGARRNIIPGKGSINAKLSAFFFKLLAENNIPTHFVEMVDSSTLRVIELRMMPLEVVCRNIATGRLVKTYPFFKKGEKLPSPLVEFFLKDDFHHDPLLSEEHMKIFNLANAEEIRNMKEITLKVNGILTEFLKVKGLELVDFKLEFGRDKEGKLRVGDELDLDSMRLWDLETGKSVDKDVYRRGGSLEDVALVYREGLKRITGEDLR
jgi:phosphoribosylaminoimidazole-succinocarboxamide synthase